MKFYLSHCYEIFILYCETCIIQLFRCVFVVVGVYYKQAIIGLGIIPIFFAIFDGITERKGIPSGFSLGFSSKISRSSRTFCKTYKICSNVPTKSLMGYSIGKINSDGIVDGIKNLMRYFSTMLFCQQFCRHFSIPIKSSIYVNGIFHHHFSFF